MEEKIIKDKNMESNDSVVPVITVKEELTFYLLDSVLAYVLLALGFCFIHFVVWNVTGIFTTLFFLSTAIICMIYLKMSNYRLNKKNVIWFVLTLIFSLVFSITANNFIKFLDTVFVMLLGIYWVYTVCRDNGRIDRFFLLLELSLAILIAPIALDTDFSIITFFIYSLDKSLYMSYPARFLKVFSAFLYFFTLT
jgi:hypothetical protein